MSIELKIEDYCQNCPDFEGEVHKYPVCPMDSNVRYNNTVITCSHKNRCAAIKRYLENLGAKKDGSIC